MPSKRQKTAGKQQRRNSRKTRRIRRRGGAENYMGTFKLGDQLEKERMVEDFQWSRDAENYPKTLPKKMRETKDPNDPKNPKNLVTFLNEDLDVKLIKDKDIRISIGINAIKPHADLKEKLATDIEAYQGEDLKKIFNEDNILKLCKLDKEIGQAFINKGIVKKGKLYGYSIVDSPKA